MCRKKEKIILRGYKGRRLSPGQGKSRCRSSLCQPAQFGDQALESLAEGIR
jgi:hypothetical protein